MRIDDTSICIDCKKFEHECGIHCGNDDFRCEEHCHSSNMETIDKFHECTIVTACDDFETC